MSVGPMRAVIHSEENFEETWRVCRLVCGHVVKLSIRRNGDGKREPMPCNVPCEECGGLPKGFSAGEGMK